MSEKSKEVVKPDVQTQEGLGSLITEKISRRSFGKILGAQTLLASAAMVGCGGGGGGGHAVIPGGGGSSGGSDDPGAKALTRAEFVAMVSDYFDWAHSSEYIDQFKSLQPTFADVSLGVTPYAKQIETALEESLIDNSLGYFYPDNPITREDAADIYAKAFMIASASNALASFSDAASISADRKDGVNAMVAAGFMPGKSATQFDPKGTVSVAEAQAILDDITAKMVAPVQVMPKPGSTSPRRYVSYTTPTDGATIYITESFDGTEPADPRTSAGMEYDFVKNGTRAYVVDDGRAGTLKVPAPRGTIRVRAVAKKDGVFGSVRSFMWSLNRPNADDESKQPFEFKLVHEGTATAPTVWKIYNMAESVQAFSFLILGKTRGIIFDFLQVNWQNGDMKPVADMLAGGIPYDAVLGHNHVDHVAQIGNFSTIGKDGKGGVGQWGGRIYATGLDKAQLMAVTNNAGYKQAGDEAVELEDGHVFDLGGGIKVTAWHQPGHEDGLVTLVTSNGWIYATDMWACNRPYTADTTGYSGVRSDLFLSFTRQLLANYKKSITHGQILECTNAHQEAPVKMEGVNNFVKCFQKMIDDGPSATEGSIRGGINRMSMVHNSTSNVKGMWRDKNWMAVEIGANPYPSEHKDFRTFTETNTQTGVVSNVMTAVGTTLSYPCNNTVDYNTAEGYKKYSVLANLEIAGGTLVGVDVYWNEKQAAGSVDRKLTNKFDPWTYNYTIKAMAGAGSLTVTPWAMSSKFKSMKVNGTDVAQGASTTVSAAAGSSFTVVVVSPDGSQTSTYTFTVTA